MLCSKKRFQIVEQGDALEFLSWLLNALEQASRPRLPQAGKSAGSKATRRERSIIARVLRGSMRVYSRKIMPANLSEEEKSTLADNPEYMVSNSIGFRFQLYSSSML